MSILNKSLRTHLSAAAWLALIHAVCGAEPVDFNRDVRPILAAHCFACHGPDAGQREAGLRLDVRDAALRPLSSGDTAIVPADPSLSGLVRRIESTDESERMPPAEFNKPLSDKQRELLRRWVAEGAPYSRHWSLINPRKAELKDVHGDASLTPIDRFVRAELQRQKLKPSEPATRHTLLRRLYLDLTGLPPTPAQVKQFLDDRRNDAYERVVDQLLASPLYGEHMARYWLDVVRYADTHGMHFDNFREMWPYRDWVVDAFNDNKRFDVFIAEQLAGDLLPNPTLQQQIASGYNRLNVTTNEGGSIYEEVHMRNVVDRVEAFGTVFLGMTTGCAVCHDHKFDPLTMKDFYQLYAFFNSLDGRAMDGNVKDHPPVVRVPNRDQQRNLKQFDRQLAELGRMLKGPIESVDKTQHAWEQSLRGEPSERPSIASAEWSVWRPSDLSHSAGQLKLAEDAAISSKSEGSQAVLELQAPLSADQTWTAVKLTALPGPQGEPHLALLSEFEVELNRGGERWEPARVLSAAATGGSADPKHNVAFAIDGKSTPGEGWGVPVTERAEAIFWLQRPIRGGPKTQVRVRLRHVSQESAVALRRIRLSATDVPSLSELHGDLDVGSWYLCGPFPVDTISRAYRGDLASEGGQFRADEVFNYRQQAFRWARRDDLADARVNSLEATAQEMSVCVLHREIRSDIEQTVTFLIGTDDGFRLTVNGSQVKLVQGRRPLEAFQDAVPVRLKKGVNSVYLRIVNHGADSAFTFAIRSPASPVPPHIRRFVDVKREDRHEGQVQEVRTFYRWAVATDRELDVLRRRRDQLRVEKKNLMAAVPTTLVFRELATPRPAFILQRGQYNNPGERVPRATPAFLPALPSGAPENRLGLARWLTSRDHPLTARVAVNRFWQQLFGVGLVATSEDFGVQGDRPSHPQLLDWLAVDFRESNWDVKRLMKQIVMSKTYQQTSRVSAALYQRDPTNRWLARGPRFRLDAETLRDQALAVGGLLNPTIGGPSVKPPQPPGLWKAVAFVGSDTGNFKADSGSSIYRRSLYTFWKRTAPAPTMTTFDAPSRESCTARRERTNTPLQALLLMNETQNVEAARGLAQRIMRDGGVQLADRLRFAFETVLGRPPDKVEAAEVVSLYADNLKTYWRDPEAAKQLVHVGSPPDAELNVSELAAWTVVGNLLLNLDEFVTKN